MKINRLGIRRSCFCFEKKKAYKIVQKNLEKDTGISKHRKRQQKLNISDLESTFNASNKNCRYIFGKR
jgi:hypothetical protein